MTSDRWQNPVANVCVNPPKLRRATSLSPSVLRLVDTKTREVKTASRGPPVDMSGSLLYAERPGHTTT